MDYQWTRLRDEAARAFSSYPDAATEQTIIDAFENQPTTVAAAVRKIIQRVQAGRLRASAGWLIVQCEVENINRPAADLVATDTHERERAFALADRWMQHAGMHFPSEREVLDELFGARGSLRRFTDEIARERMVKKYRELRPIGEQLDQEMLARADAYTARGSSPQSPVAEPCATRQGNVYITDSDRVLKIRP